MEDVAARRKTIDEWDLAEEILQIPGTHVGLYGPPGTGKTYLANTVTDGRDWAIFNMTITEDTEAFELRGNVRPMDGEDQARWDWIDGIAIMAWRASHELPTRLVVNEIHKAAGDALTFLHGIAEDVSAISTSMVLPRASKEIVRPGPSFQLVVTMNDEPEQLDDAFADRFHWFNIEKVNPKAIAALPEHLQNTATAVCNLKGSDPRRVSLRAWFGYVHLTEHGMKRDRAAYAAFGKSRYKEILDAIDLAEAEAKARKTRLKPLDAIMANPDFDRGFSSWEDVMSSCTTAYCANHNLENAPVMEHSTWRCKALLFIDKQEADDFWAEHSDRGPGQTEAERRAYSLRHRTRTHGTTWITNTLTEWS